MAKRFFFICAGILCLAFAYHLGAVNATAQGSATKIRLMELSGGQVCVVTESQDIYLVDPAKLRNVATGPGWSKFSLDAVK